MVQHLVRLMRPKHYIKNGLIIVPLLFGNQLFDIHKLGPLIGALIVFSLLSSVVYIINDIRDVAKDRLHPDKKRRPLASGAVSVRQAVILAVVLLLAVSALSLLMHSHASSWLLLLSYLIINVAYSFGLKNIPIVDIALLASGFVIRVLYGASVFNISVSHWLYMTIVAGAFYVSLGKRRNEIIVHGTKSRKVNEMYSLQFLDKNMYVCFGLTLVFYSLWATDPARMNTLLYATIPFLILLFMTYSLQVEKDNSTGDPVDVILRSRALQIMVPAYAIVMILAVYS